MVKDRSLKDEMRNAVRGDRERAEARRKAEAEGATAPPSRPTIDLNKPVTELKRPVLPPVEPAPQPEPEAELEPLEEPVPDAVDSPEPEPPPELRRGFLARLFRR